MMRGSSVGAYDVKGRDLGNVRTEGEQQIFFTGGLYKLCDPRHDDPLSWGSCAIISRRSTGVSMAPGTMQSLNAGVD